MENHAAKYQLQSLCGRQAQKTSTWSVLCTICRHCISDCTSLFFLCDVWKLLWSEMLFHCCFYLHIPMISEVRKFFIVFHLYFKCSSVFLHWGDVLISFPHFRMCLDGFFLLSSTCALYIFYNDFISDGYWITSLSYSVGNLCNLVLFSVRCRSFSV